MNTPTESTGTFRPGAWLPAAALVLSLLLLGVGGCSSDDEDVYVSEGAIATPVDLGSTLPVTYSGTVGASPSYYMVTVLDLTSYIITLTGLRYDADLVVYAEANQFVGPALCASVSLGTAEESCAVISAGTTLFIMVPSHSEFGSGFSLSVIEIIP